MHTFLSLWAVTDVFFVRAVEYRCHGVLTQVPWQPYPDALPEPVRCSPREGTPSGVQNDIQRCLPSGRNGISSSGRMRETTYPCCRDGPAHLIAHRDLPLLCDVAANQLIDTRRQLLTQFSRVKILTSTIIPASAVRTFRSYPALPDAFSPKMARSRLTLPRSALSRPSGDL